MSTGKNKWIEAVGRLLQLTQNRELIWRTLDPPPDLNGHPEDKRVDVVYETQYGDRTLRLYELKFKVESPHPFIRVASVFDLREFPYWTEKATLELLDQKGLSAWKFPDMDVIDHLLTAVRYQVVGVKEFLDEILVAAG